GVRAQLLAGLQVPELGKPPVLRAPVPRPSRHEHPVAGQGEQLKKIELSRLLTQLHVSLRFAGVGPPAAKHAAITQGNEVLAVRGEAQATRNEPALFQLEQFSPFLDIPEEGAVLNINIDHSLVVRAQDGRRAGGRTVW